MKIPLEITKMRDPSGKDSFKAIISLQDAITGASQSQKLIQIQNQYATLLNDWQELLQQIRSDRKRTADPKLQWKLANDIYTFIKQIESGGYIFANVSEALQRDLGLSKSTLNYLLKLRTYYTKRAQISKRINWSKYREILDIKDSKTRKICEQKILSGEIKTDHEIRAFKRRHKDKILHPNTK